MAVLSLDEPNPTLHPSWLRERFGEIGILEYENHEAGDGAVDLIDEP